MLMMGTLPGGASTRRGTFEQRASNPHQTGFLGLDAARARLEPIDADLTETRRHFGKMGAYENIMRKQRGASHE